MDKPKKTTKIMNKRVNLFIYIYIKGVDKMKANYAWYMGYLLGFWEIIKWSIMGGEKMVLHLTPLYFQLTLINTNNSKKIKIFTRR